MRVEAQPQIEIALGMLAASRARQLGRPRDRVGRRVDVAGRNQEARLPVEDHFLERAAPEGHDGCPARLRLGGDHPERLFPPGRAENDRCTTKRLPDDGSRNAWVDDDARIGAAGVDSLPRVLRVIAVAVNVDPDVCRTRNFDRLDRSLLGTQPAGKDRAFPGRCATSESIRVGTNGARITSTETSRRQALAWHADTTATVGAGPERAASRRASATVASGGR